MNRLDLPLVDPKREISGFKPLKVLHHFRKLVADKEDTKQVFHIIEALKGKKSHRQAWKFIQSKTGSDLLVREDNLSIPDMLDDHSRWENCAPNSVAKHYISFMQREGLTANGLVDESLAWVPLEDRPKDQTEWYFSRLRDTHDLFHVLTGYGRDALGEAALLGYSFEQNHNLGIKFIAYAAAREIKNSTGTKAPIYAAIKEGRALGKAAGNIAHQDIEALMHEDIDEARKRLNIAKPLIYRQCLAILEQEGFAEENLGLQNTSEPNCSNASQAA